MLSRDADNCFWIGRYVERAEATARMVDVHYHAALESALPPEESEELEQGTTPMPWKSIITISDSAEDYAAAKGEETDRDVLHFFTFDTDNPNSILSCWRNARENARAIREQISSEMWESLNVSYLQLREWNADRILATTPHEFYQLVKNSSHLFQGILNRTMMMGETRDWLDTGRFLERSGQTARLTDVKYHDLLPQSSSSEDGSSEVNPFGVGGPLDTHGWIAVLKSVSAFEMYRKTYHDGIKPASVVGFLVLSAQFPASVRHGIGRVESCLRRISGNTTGSPINEPERFVGRLYADLTYARPDEIIHNGLHEYLENVQNQCELVGLAIINTYLSY